MVKMYTEHISSNGSHFLTAGFLIKWTDKVKTSCNWEQGYNMVGLLKVAMYRLL